MFELPDVFNVIDVESNGLYGQPFLIGLVTMNWGGRVLDIKYFRCPIDEVIDDWVSDHVLPHVMTIKENYEDVKAMIDGFEEYVRMPGDSTLPMFVDCGFPVDFGFLHLVGKRHWNSDELSPYPVHDICSILASHGLDPLIDREKYAQPMRGPLGDRVGNRGERHDPVWDAETSGLCMIRAIKYAK